MSTGLTISTDELLVSTLNKQGRKVFDQYFQKNPTWKWFQKNGGVDWDGSGNAYTVPISIGRNTSSGKFSGYDTLDTTPVSTLKEVSYAIKNYYASVTYSQEMKWINRGNLAIIKLLEHKVEEAKKSILYNLSVDMHASSVASKAIESLQTICDSTGATGQLNQSSESTWAAYEAACGSFAAGGIEAMELAYNTCSKGLESGSPDLIVTTQTVFQYLQDAMRSYGMISMGSGPIRGDLGVEEIKFNGAQVIWDPYALSGTMLFLNSNGVGLVIDGEANMKATEFVKPTNQMAYTGQIYMRTQIVCKERRSLGKLTGITA
jgi:hypothetical protein